MRLVKWEKLPADMQTEEVREYYDVLRKKRFSLFWKRIFDIFVSAIMLIILSPLFLILAIKQTVKVPYFTVRKGLRNTENISEYSNSGRWCKTQIKVRKLP